MSSTRRAGHAPAAGPPSRDIISLSEVVAQVNSIKQMMQSIGLDKDWILSGVDADKPTAAIQNRIYCATDTQATYLDTGSSWIKVGQV